MSPKNNVLKDNRNLPANHRKRTVEPTKLGHFIVFEWLVETEMTADELSVTSGVDRDQLDLILNDSRHATDEELQGLSKALGVSYKMLENFRSASICFEQNGWS